ncbi:type VII toxin-antitoxin system MntA family adenylyltransferase antitoxin [Desulfoscipio geothermicus]|uniref:Polymerase beta nucleotidyltransferase domain-containing protein n=1 Tax=Desulfoscipio geothermicus DSM 3669 TaxID=1121426 RepID=A0A1I6DEL0_9FIRM|nr:nucleotidyltransferase domain-containing protein [Desulfoscipio geothermicus]SFR03837.1 hypothetical protein SAMN05660706_109103 [Desulfoscipio geothermicus DSM 3669]
MARTSFGKKQKKFSIGLTEKTSLLEKLTHTLNKQTNAAFAYIHGSFLDDQAFGDVDIAIYYAENNLPPKEQIIQHELSLEMILQEKFNYLFDVRIINNAPLSFCYNVLKNGRLLYSNDEELRIQFVTRTIDDYIDFLPYRKRYLREVLGLEI